MNDLKWRTGVWAIASLYFSYKLGDIYTRYKWATSIGREKAELWLFTTWIQIGFLLLFLIPFAYNYYKYAEVRK